MPPPAFTLSVPADKPFRTLAADAVRAYFGLSGAAGPGADEFAAAVAGAVDRLAEPGADVEMVVLAHPAEIEVRLTCAGTSETLTHPVPAGS